MSDFSSDHYKSEGNKAFSAGNYDTAIELFSKGIEKDPNNHILYSNRSASYSALGKFDVALEDAKRTVELAPNWAKSYSRLAAAHHGLRQYSEAESAANKGLEIEPNNAALRKCLDDIRTCEADVGMNMFSRVFSDPSIWDKIARNPKISHILSDSNTCSQLKLLATNPSLFTSFSNSNPKLMEVALALLLGDMGNNFDFSKAADSPPPEEQKPKEEKPVEVQPVKSLTDEEKEFQKLKDEGNNAYKSRDFETALLKWSEADKCCGGDPSILANMGAAYYETQKYSECFDVCKRAVDLARDKMTDYALVAKALARAARALEAQGKLKEALDFYKQSMAEKRNPDVQKNIAELEKEIKRREKEDYRNPSLSDAARERGNSLFSAGDFAQAIKEYTEAINRNDKDARPYANRATCYHKLGALPDALKDCDKSIELDPRYVKAYLRKAQVLFMKKDYSATLDVCEKAERINSEELSRLQDLKSKLDSTTGKIDSASDIIGTESLDNIQKQIAICGKQTSEISMMQAKCIQAINDRNRAMRANDDPKKREEIINNAMNNPEIASIMRDPSMGAILQQMQEDPRAAAQYMSDPQVANKIRKLIAAGIIAEG